MWFAVLGPLEVSLDRDLDALGGAKQRRLLAMLLLRAPETVARDQLVAAMWGACPPPSASDSLDTYVYRLRKLLGPDRVQRRPGGYRLQVAAEEIDAERFELLVGEASHQAADGAHEAAVRTLTEALGLWRGAAWAELLDEPAAAAESRRLEELRLEALESRAEAALSAGDGAGLVPELERLVHEHPLRERLLRCLMVALYRAGRQADALEALNVARRGLLEELGLEPEPATYELQARILRHDPDLGGAPALRLGRRSVRPRRRRRRLATVALAALMLALGVAVLANGRPRHRYLRPGANGLVALPAFGTRVVAAAEFAGALTAEGAGAGSLWVADADNGTVTRISDLSGAAVDRITVGGEPTGVVAGGGDIWVADAVGDEILRIDPASETVTQTISLNGDDPTALTFAGGRVWVVEGPDRAISEIDPGSGRVLRTISVTMNPTVVTFGAGAVWLAGYDSGIVLRLDPRDGAVTGRVTVGVGSVALAFAGGALWVANGADSTLTRIDPTTLRRSATLPVGPDPQALVGGSRRLWVADGAARAVVQVDARRATVVRTVRVGGDPTSLANAGGRIWVGVTAGDDVHRGGTLVIAAVGPFASIDPAFFNLAPTAQFPGLVYDTLVTFDHTDGAAGLRLVPDLALSLPAPSDGGRTYVFRLRPGIRYSSGRLVRAEDVVRAFQRLFQVGSPGEDYYTDIVGAAGCLRRPAACRLSRGIVADDATGRIVFHLVAPDPEFLDALTEEDYTAPVPPGTPGRDTGLHPFPGTGPYVFARSSVREVEFVRNRFFRMWSAAAQPPGNPDVILWRLYPSTQVAAHAVATERADWLNGIPSAALYRRIAIQAPTRLHSESLFAVAFFPLNAHLAPFDNVLARRALNLAVDRRRIAAIWGGAAFATPACQPLAPGLPGFRRYCPYTVDPDSAGTYTGPDLALARRLVNRSGTAGDHVTVWGNPVGPYPPPQVTAYVASVLRSLGYRTTIRLRPFQDITPTMRLHFQMSTDGDWLADYPDPSSYLPQFFACGGGNSNGYVCNPALDRRMQQAAALEQRAPAAAEAQWASVDRTLTDQAYWVPTVSNRDVDLVSARLGNYEFNPVWGFLPDQAWVR